VRLPFPKVVTVVLAPIVRFSVDYTTIVVPIRKLELGFSAVCKVTTSKFTAKLHRINPIFVVYG